MYTTGMRQNRLAKLLGMDQAYLSRIVNGVREPRQRTRQEIASVLGCDAEWLFERTALEASGKMPGQSVEFGNALLTETLND
jgi:transcriptional regulator with XRE-family HTH domain